MIIRSAYYSIDQDSPSTIYIISNNRNTISIINPLKNSDLVPSYTNYVFVLKHIFPGIQEVPIGYPEFVTTDVDSGIFHANSLKLIKDFNYFYYIKSSQRRNAGDYISYDFAYLLRHAKRIQNYGLLRSHVFDYTKLKNNITMECYKTTKLGKEHYVCFPRLK